MDKVEIKNWDDLDLKGDLLRGIYGYGFEKPSEIQKKAIHPIINNHDVIAQAQSGTCLLYTSPSPRDLSTSRMPSSA